MPKLRTAAPSTRRRRWKVADARSVLAALGASGLSLAEFARRAGLSPERLYRWRRALAADERRAASRAEVIEIRPRRAEPVEIVLASGRVLRVSETIDVSALARLVAVLEHA
jgi:transposase-like protein